MPSFPTSEVPQSLLDGTFKGQVLHSHYYRKPDPYAGILPPSQILVSRLPSADRFSGKSVLVVGAGASGTDLSYEIASVAAQISLTSRPKP